MLIVYFPSDFPLKALIDFASAHGLVVRRSSADVLTFKKNKTEPDASKQSATGAEQ